MSDKYDDIINYDWKGAQNREKIPIESRAKIFMPFSALNGFGDILKKISEENEEKYKSRLSHQPVSHQRVDNEF